MSDPGSLSGLAAWVGLSVAPLQLLDGYNFSSFRIIATAIVLGVLIAAFAYCSEIKNFKSNSNKATKLATESILIAKLL